MLLNISKQPFVAIDFETACYPALSACSVGVASFKNGNIVEKREWLIKPVDAGRFSFTKTHGITWNDVKDKPTFKDIWPELQKIINGKTLVAHNAVFDLNILKEHIVHFELEPLLNDHHCTLALAKKFFPLITDHKLETIASLLSLEYGNHQAGADAHVSGQIYLKILEHLKDPERALGTNPIKAATRSPELINISIDLGQPAEKKQRGDFRSTKPADLDGIEIDVIPEVDSDFFIGKCCVITGNFATLSRLELPDTLSNHGAKISKKVTGKIDFLILGTEPGWSKIDEVKALKQSGREIAILDEAELLHILAQL